MFPTTRIEATRMAVPVGCLYTPLRNIDGMPAVNYQPIMCKAQHCGGILNPYCRVDFMNKIWVCPFCLTRNHFPHHYADISPENLPAEIIPQFTTMEYILTQEPPKAPVFLFVLDTCIIEEELQQLKTSLLQTLMLLPEHSLVGLITFGNSSSSVPSLFPLCSLVLLFLSYILFTLSFYSVLGLVTHSHTHTLLILFCFAHKPPHRQKRSYPRIEFR